MVRIGHFLAWVRTLVLLWIIDGVGDVGGVGGLDGVGNVAKSAKAANETH